MIELFAVAPHEDEAFRAAWEDEAHTGTTLYRALRADARYRFASVEGGPANGVILITDARADLEPLAGRQGFLGIRKDGDLALVHWSSPLMYARTGLDLPGALYAPRAMSDRIEQLRATIEQARDLRAEISFKYEQTCWVGASVQGDLVLSLQLPRGRLFGRRAADEGRRWLADHGFTLSESNARYVARRGADASELARLLDDALTHALRVSPADERSDSLTLPAVLPGLPCPPADASVAEHLTAALTGIVDARQGLVDVYCGLPYESVGSFAVWEDELRVLVFGRDERDPGVEAFLPLEDCVAEAVGKLETALLAYHHADGDALFIQIFDGVDPAYTLSHMYGRGR